MFVWVLISVKFSHFNVICDSYFSSICFLTQTINYQICDVILTYHIDVSANFRYCNDWIFSLLFLLSRTFNVSHLHNSNQRQLTRHITLIMNFCRSQAGGGREWTSKISLRDRERCFSFSETKDITCLQQNCRNCVIFPLFSHSSRSTEQTGSWWICAVVE